jgi:hypothetical protein
VKTGCGLNSATECPSRRDTQTFEGPILQERINNHEENEKNLRSANCHGYGTWYEHKRICCR